MKPEQSSPTDILRRPKLAKTSSNDLSEAALLRLSVSADYVGKERFLVVQITETQELT